MHFFGLPGGNDDLNVLDHSPLIRKLVEGNDSRVGFWVNKNCIMMNTTFSPMAFTLSGIASSNPFKNPRTKKKAISLELKNLRAKM